MSKFQVGDEVAVDFSGKVKKIELCYDGKIKYVVETEREMCIVLESAVLPLPKSEEDFKKWIDFKRESLSFLKSEGDFKEVKE